MKERAKARPEGGQALTEFLVVALALVPLFLLMPLIAKYQDIAHQTEMASRYVAFDAVARNEWQNSWKDPGQLAGEVRRRFFSNPDAPILTCRADDRPIGITLLFQSAGRPVVVQRFDPDGRRGPVPGAVGGIYPRGGAEMSFMPGDSRRGMPTFVEVEWAVPTKEFETWSAGRQKKSNAERYTPEGQAEYRQEWAKVPSYTKRIDLTSIISPELVEQVRADRQNTQLKLIITFNDENVDIKAHAYKWR